MLKIYCDGACSGNPGIGGWAFVIPELNVEMSGYQEETTNNRMEITAAYKALEYLCYQKKFIAKDVEIITDSQYVVNTMNNGWKKNKNTDLWSYLDYFKFYFNPKWTWVKGHASNEYNQRCDELAVGAYKNQIAFEKSKIKNKVKEEIQLYGEKVTVNNPQKIRIEFEPYEKYLVGKEHFVTILKCNCIEDVYASEADENKLLTIGSYKDCKSSVQNYKDLVENNFKEILF